MVRHFLDIHRLDAADLRAILDDAHARKAARNGWPQGRADADAPGKDRVLAMIFEKNSTRTRFSFDAAIRQLGGSSIIATASDMQLGRGEPVEDTARVLSRMVDAVMIRANDHEDVERFARVSTVPVINGLTDRSHPCQITDTWVSMGDQDYEARLAAFEHYGVDEALMDLADPEAVFLHCLPAHRGEEVTDAVIDGPRSLVWDEAENRIHAQKAVLAWCFGG